MKKFLLPSILLCAATAYAQTSSYSLNIHLKNGESVKYEVTDIDRMTFEAPEEEETPDPVETANVKVTIPTSFATGWVQKVMYDGKQVAEIDQEYVKAVDNIMIVVYPCGADGRADLTKGVSSTGASVVWDLDANTATVGEAGDDMTTFYIVDGEVLTSYDGELPEATVEADVISDRRGLFERNTYTIVKIGTQYWMAENLRTTYYLDGTSIQGVESKDTSTWSANTTGAYVKIDDTEWLKMAGYLYNGYCVTSEKEIAPEGWEVPTRDQVLKLRSAGNILATNFKDSEPGSWSNGTEGENVTGFSAIATGYYSSATGMTGELSEAYFWTSTVYSDWLFKTEGLETLRINGTSKNIAVSSEAGHSYPFGHSIRCVRK